MRVALGGFAVVMPVIVIVVMVMLVLVLVLMAMFTTVLMGVRVGLLVRMGLVTGGRMVRGLV